MGGPHKKDVRDAGLASEARSRPIKKSAQLFLGLLRKYNAYVSSITFWPPLAALGTKGVV